MRSFANNVFPLGRYNFHLQLGTLRSVMSTFNDTTTLIYHDDIPIGTFKMWPVLGILL